MATYTVSLRTNRGGAKALGKLKLMLMGHAASVSQDGERFNTSMEDDANRRKLELALADFDANTVPILVLRTFGPGPGAPLDLAEVLANAGAPAGAPSVPAGAQAGTMPSGVAPMATPGVVPPPGSPSMHSFSSVPAAEEEGEETSVPVPQPAITQQVMPAPAPPPIVTSPSTGAAPETGGTQADPNAIAMAAHIDVLRQIYAAKPATIRMLRFLQYPPSPPFQLEDYMLIARRINNPRTGMDMRGAGAQRVIIRIRDRGYQISTDRSMPPDQRFVLYQSLPSGDLVRIAEGSNPKAVAWAIPIFEQGITAEQGWEARLGRIHGASINGVPPGQRREP